MSDSKSLTSNQLLCSICHNMCMRRSNYCRLCGISWCNKCVITVITKCK